MGCAAPCCRHLAKWVPAFASVLIAKFVSVCGKVGTNFAIRTPASIDGSSVIQIEKSASSPSRARPSGLLDHHTRMICGLASVAPARRNPGRRVKEEQMRLIVSAVGRLKDGPERAL